MIPDFLGIDSSLNPSSSHHSTYQMTFEEREGRRRRRGTIFMRFSLMESLIAKNRSSDCGGFVRPKVFGAGLGWVEEYKSLICQDRTLNSYFYCYL